MKILTGSRIREADRYTIARESIDSIALMERASESIAQWVAGHVRPEYPLAFFVGKGNNGGDGLAVARMLHRAGFSCAVYLAFGRDELSEECRFNLERLPRGLPVRPMAEASLPEGTVIVDALLGTGVRGELTEPLLGAVRRINSSGCRVVSIDLPSGMFSEFGNAGYDGPGDDDADAGVSETGLAASGGGRGGRRGRRVADRPERGVYGSGRVFLFLYRRGGCGPLAFVPSEIRP